MRSLDLRPTFGPIYDQDFVHNISLMHLGLWFGLASGSDDHTVRLWDLRKKKCAYTLPAHSSLISHVRFEATGASPTP